MPGHAAIQYAPDAFDTRVSLMMGRQKAGETFFAAWIKYAGADPLTGWTHNQKDNDAFVAHARELGHAGPIACANEATFGALERAGALWLADPNLARYAWQRRFRSQTAWSLVGITHTLSSMAAMDLIAAMLTAPVQRWDALICTSRAVEKAVAATLDAEADYLAARLGAGKITGPELPIIPLGVPCDALAFDPADRARWRAELGIAEDEVAILQFGRMALHAKAHPLPLMLAVAGAAARGGARLRLIFAGQFINARQGEMFNALASHFANQFQTDFIDGARADVAGVRAAADIFTLLSDNMQESFGLAPVEAMAAGLPVVASDWDGLRDTIEHGVTGIRIDTSMPPPDAGEAIARRHALTLDNPDQYISASSQSTEVDIGQAADAFAALAADPALRRRMGEAGVKRARALYDWPIIIQSYRALLAQLAERRLAGVGERAPRGANAPAQPARMDPFRNFAAHATARLTRDTRLDRAPGGPVLIDDLPGELRISLLHQPTLPPLPILEAMIAAVGGGPIRIGDLLPLFPGMDHERLYCGIGWLLKFGFLRRV